nr:ORF119 [Acipenserid herpesvirus 1]
MASTMTHKQLICERGITLDELQDCINSNPDYYEGVNHGYVRLYFNKDAKPEHVVDNLRTIPDFLFVNKIIYNLYLDRYVVKQKLEGESETVEYIYLDAAYESAVLFLTCLYLKFFNLITLEGELKTHRLNLNPLNNYSGELLELARFYDLDWLKLLFIKTVTTRTHFNGYVFLSNNLLTVVNPSTKEMFSVGAPAWIRAFTMSPDGSTWYALCSPKPDLIELWIKKYNENSWTLMTSICEPKDAAIVKQLVFERHLDIDDPIQHFQLTLAESVCLYVLKNKQQLICFNMATQTWHKISLCVNAPSMTFCMVKTGDMTLPLTLVANAYYKYVITCRFAQNAWCWDKTENKESVFQTNVIVEDTNNKIAQLRKEPAANFWSGLIKHQLKPEIHAKIEAEIREEFQKKADLQVVQCEGEGDDYFAGPSRKRARTFTNEPRLDTEDKDNFTNPLFKKLNNPCDNMCVWTDVVMAEGVLYGKRLDNSWWICTMSANATKMSKWMRLEANGSEGIWHSEQKCIDWVSPTFISRINFFNPNYTDENMINVKNHEGKMIYQASRCNMVDHTNNSVTGGLDCLANIQVQKERDDFLCFNRPKHEVPLPLALLLNNISEQTAEEFLTTGAIKYENGGVCPMDDLHPLTQTKQLEVFTLTPPTSHVILRDNFWHMLTRYAYDSVPVLQGVGSFLMTNECSAYTLFNDFNRNRFVFESNNTCAVLKPFE